MMGHRPMTDGGSIMKIAGLDIGTTGCKLTVFDEGGRYLDKAYQDYKVRRVSGEHEVDAHGIMDGVWLVIRQMAEKYPDIAGIGVTSFGETFVAADGEGTPLYPAMLYTDPRGFEECRELSEKLGRREILHITGVDAHEMYSISKMMWLKRHVPQVYERASHLFLIEDYVVFHLTGKAQIDYSLAARTQAFDIQKLAWSERILETAGIEKSLLSEPVPTGTPAGHIKASVAEKTGLMPETMIVSISHDQMSAAIGAGVFSSDIGVDGAGTVECITSVYDGIPDLDAMNEGKFAVAPYVIPGKYLGYAFSYMGGGLISWCVEAFAKKEKELAEKEGISVNSYLERGYSEPTGLLVLPHFAGAATPYMDSGSKGAILGLDASVTTEQLYCACMEGVVYEMLLNMEYLEKSGIPFHMLHATGGGARSEIWMQMKADMLNMPITALGTADAGTVGSAMLTGIAAGCFADLEDAAAHMVEKKKVYEPRSHMHEQYRKIYERYRRVYDAVRPLV